MILRYFFTSLACLTVAVGLLISVQSVHAAIPKNALGAVATMPDGKTILAAGDNRVLYVIDAETLAVQKRIWLGVNPLAIIVSKDASKFAVHDTDSNVTLFDLNTFKPVHQFSKTANAIAYAENTDTLYMAARPSGNHRTKTFKTKISNVVLSTNKVGLQLTVDIGVGAIGVEPDGSQITMVSSPIRRTNAEEKAQPPKDLRGLERYLFQQKHDDAIAKVRVVGADGKEVTRFQTWFGSIGRDATVVKINGKPTIVSYHQYGAQFDIQSGATQIFEGSKTYNYGIGGSVTAQRLVLGGLRTGATINTETGAITKFSIQRLGGGWPEYFKSFAVAKDGTVYGTTTAYRLVKILPDGQVDKVVPVH